MSDVLDRVRDYVLELGLAIDSEIPEEEILIVNDEERAISHLVIDLRRHDIGFGTAYCSTAFHGRFICIQETSSNQSHAYFWCIRIE